MWTHQNTDDEPYPYGYYTQISDGPAGTTSQEPVIGGYVHPRQCQTTAYSSDHDQTGEGTQTGFHHYLYKRPNATTKRMFNKHVPQRGLAELPDGDYTEPFISSSSPFARGPYVVFTTNSDLWNNNTTTYTLFRYRVFHDLLTQYSYTVDGDVGGPEIADGGGWTAFHSDAEILNERKGVRGVGDGPFNADHNNEIFWIKGRRRAWQITQSENCENTDVSLSNDGHSFVFYSTCDLIPGHNPNNLPQLFVFQRVRRNTPLTTASECRELDACCNEANGCYLDLPGALNRIPRKNRPFN